MNKSIILTIIVILDSLSTVITNTKTFIEMFSWHFKIKNAGGTAFICISDNTEGASLSLFNFLNRDRKRYKIAVKFKK